MAEELKSLASLDAVIVSFQNGVGNAKVLGQALPDHTALGGIVSFNVVSAGGGVFQQGTSGPLVIEASDDVRVHRLVVALRDSGFLVETPAVIAPHQYAKLLMNLGNAISALSDAPTRDMILTPGYRRILGAQLRVNSDARSSMWEDLTRGRPTEIDYLNGEIVKLAEANGLEAPLNRRITELVHTAENEGNGSPKLTPESLSQALNSSGDA